MIGLAAKSRVPPKITIVVPKIAMVTVVIQKQLRKTARVRPCPEFIAERLFRFRHS